MEHKDPLEELATAPLPSADPGVQLAEAAQAAGAGPESLPAGAVAAPPGTGAVQPAATGGLAADAVSLSLDVIKKEGGDAAGKLGFQQGAWNGGGRQGEALKGAAKGGVNLLTGLGAVAAAKTADEREKAITDLASGTAGDAAGIVAGEVAGAGVKGLVSVALAKNAKERKEAITDGVIDTAAEAAGGAGGNVAKASVQAVGGLTDVFSKPAGSFDRAATSQRHFTRVAETFLPWGIGKFLGNKLIGAGNDYWAKRNGGVYNAGDGTYTLPNGTIYDPKKGAPTAENVNPEIPALTDADKRRLDEGTPR